MRNRGSLYVGILLLAFGGVFLLAQLSSTLMGPLNIHLGWGRLWPLIILLVGVAFLVPILIWWNERHKIIGLAVPGTIITVNGLILLYQALSGDWSSWAYLWTLEPISVGLGLLAMYALGLKDRGLLIGAAIVGGIGLFFFVIFSSLFGGWLKFLVPVVLIVVGLVLLMRGFQDRAHEDGPRE